MTNYVPQRRALMDAVATLVGDHVPTDVDARGRELARRLADAGVPVLAFYAVYVHGIDAGEDLSRAIAQALSGPHHLLFSPRALI